MNTRVIQSGSSSSRSRLWASKILVVFWFLLSCFLAFNPEPWEGHGREYGTEFNCISLQTLSGESAETGRQMKTDKTMWILEKEKSVWKDGWQGGCGDGKVWNRKGNVQAWRAKCKRPDGASVIFRRGRAPGQTSGALAPPGARFLRLLPDRHGARLKWLKNSLCNTQMIQGITLWIVAASPHTQNLTGFKILSSVSPPNQIIWQLGSLRQTETAWADSICSSAWGSAWPVKCAPIKTACQVRRTRSYPWLTDTCQTLRNGITTY